MSDCRFGVSPVNYPDPDPDPDMDSPDHYYFSPNHSVRVLRVSYFFDAEILPEILNKWEN